MGLSLGGDVVFKRCLYFLFLDSHYSLKRCLVTSLGKVCVRREAKRVKSIKVDSVWCLSSCDRLYKVVFG